MKLPSLLPSSLKLFYELILDDEELYETENRKIENKENILINILKLGSDGDDSRGKKSSQIHVTSSPDHQFLHPIDDDDDDSNNYRLTKTVEVEEDDEDDDVHKTIIHLNLPSELIGEEIDVYRGSWINDQVNIVTKFRNTIILVITITNSRI